MSLGAAAEDTTIAQYRALVVLASRGPQRMVDLAAALAVTPSTAGRMCDRLLRKGLIRRHRARTDRRAVRVSITAAGRQVVDEATARRRALIADILRKLPPRQQPAIATALQAFAAAAGEIPDSQWPADPAEPQPAPQGRTRAGAVRHREGPVMTGETPVPAPLALPWTGRASGWLRGSRAGLLAIALVVGAGSGLGAVAFRYLIYFFTWLATGHVQFGQQGRVPSTHLPWLGLGFFVVIPVIGGLIYGPLIYRYAREARGHGVPEVMIAVADEGGRIRPQVAAVKSLASALCIGVGGSVGREGPIVQIGSALASSLGQWVRMPENRLRILVACGAAGGIAATFNAPITGVFFGVEIILREFSVEAIFTVMLSAMVADLVSRQFLGSAPFLSGLPSGIALHHLTSYLLVAALAVVAALLGLAFAKILYATEDLCDRLWKNRPEWARPAVGGIALGLLLLALPQMYGVGYPVLYKAVGGSYALWFLIVLAAGKIIACSLTIGIGGSGGVFAPSLFIGATSGMAFGEIAHHVLRPGCRPARPVRGRRHGRGVRLRRPGSADLGGQRRGDDRRLHPHPAGHARRRHRHSHLPRIELWHDLHHQAAAPRHRHRPPPRRRTRSRTSPPLTPCAPSRCRCPPEPRPPACRTARDRASLPGPVTHQHSPQVLFATESLTQALRQLELYGRDGLPVISDDGQHLQGWITSQNVLQAVARHIHAAQAGTAQPQPTAEPVLPGPQDDLHAGRRLRWPATRSWRSPSPPARPPPARHSATPPGRPAVSRSRSWTTTPCATPTPASPSPPATASTCSPRRQRTRDHSIRTAKTTACQTATSQRRGPPHRCRLPHPGDQPQRPGPAGYDAGTASTAPAPPPSTHYHRAPTAPGSPVISGTAPNHRRLGSFRGWAPLEHESGLTNINTR